MVFSPGMKVCVQALSSFFSPILSPRCPWSGHVPVFLYTLVSAASATLLQVTYQPYASIYLSTFHSPSIHPSTYLPSIHHLSIYLQSMHLPPIHQFIYLPSIPSSIYLPSTHLPSISPSIHLPFLPSSNYHFSPSSTHPSMIYSSAIYPPIHYASLYPFTHNKSFTYVQSTHPFICLSIHPPPILPSIYLLAIIHSWSIDPFIHFFIHLPTTHPSIHRPFIILYLSISSPTIYHSFMTNCLSIHQYSGHTWFRPCIHSGTKHSFLREPH